MLAFAGPPRPAPADPPLFHSLLDSHWINTMYRCLSLPVTRAAAAALVLFAATALPASAQVMRQFPQNAMRGVIGFDTPPTIVLNGKPAQLAPGARIRGQNNLLQMSGPLVGQKLVVHYTVESNGLVKDVWILRDDEIKVVPWPTTPAQLQSWQFDPVAQTWTKP